MSFNPFFHTDALRAEVTALVKQQYADNAITDTVLPGRSVLNPDELPGTLVFLDGLTIEEAMDRDDSKVKCQVVITLFFAATATNPDKQMDTRSKLIWAGLDGHKLACTRQPLRGQDFEYEVDPDSGLISTKIIFTTTILGA
ncbi:hypothetical protein NFHSH190041_36780 (plasmid) [Shewanella sp. NFH-SH190041]|uniref:hypothetical protein n=1 Tax=Shewanella sp. NFH-SH190041 TaxID=2950245 RepID=UPI0021C26BD4|nr:hypothetical protein [Shewanella sp. NFH-SH190041]BDM66226.1 hypothetical protein NFHSH190041_36780 [Shewanella sp. NFH-SH190041]